MRILLRDRTALVIAHRLSTVRAADKILVFHQARLVAAGTHAELYARGGLCAELYQHQFRTEPVSQPTLGVGPGCEPQEA